MGNSFFTFLRKSWESIRGWVIGGILLVTLLYWVYWAFSGVFSPMFLVRVEAYLRIVVVTLLVLTFGVLRLYNSQVANTRFLIKLRETMTKLVNEIPGIERLLKQSNSSLSQTNNKIESLDKTLERLHSKKNED